MPASTSEVYKRSVFINCPFDDAFKPLFEAMVFTVYACGYRPRCALDAQDSSEVRIDKIYDLIRDSQHSVHDLSRATGRKAARYNMPFELGIFLGAKRYGGRRQSDKRCLVMERFRHGWQKYISDIAGCDVYAHRNRVGRVILHVRDFLNMHDEADALPGAIFLRNSFAKFKQDLPKTLDAMGTSPSELQHKDFLKIVVEWQKGAEAR